MLIFYIGSHADDFELNVFHIHHLNFYSSSINSLTVAHNLKNEHSTVTDDSEIKF